MIFSTLLATITLTLSLPSDNIKTARYPVIEGTVVLQPATNDKNTCFEADGYANGGGFYIQDIKGNGIWVCPKTLDLVNGVDYGDRVRVSGLIQNDKVRILTIKASTVENLSSGSTPSTPSNIKEVIKAIDYNMFTNPLQNGLEYGDLISYEGFVELWWTEDVGAGFGITDCSGNTVKGWWTTQDGVDVYDTFNFLKPGDDASNYSPSYYKMVGFYEIYKPYFANWGGSEIQPRLQDIQIVTDPCA